MEKNLEVRFTCNDYRVTFTETWEYQETTYDTVTEQRTDNGNKESWKEVKNLLKKQ